MASHLMPKAILGLIAAISSATVFGQITLTGTNYTQDFNSIGSGLPTGWTVSTNATASGLGTPTIFTTDAISWSSTAASGVFRNTSSSNIVSTSLAGPQSSNTDRALGWRPTLAGEREGAITAEFSNTQGFTNFTLSLSVFTFNDVTAVATYALEYRIGSSGAFTQLSATYTTGTEFSSYTYSITALTLAALNDQSSPLFIRLRGTTSSGTGSLDGIGIDNFSLTYSAVPEPSAYAFFGGVTALGLAGLHRFRSRRVQSTSKPPVSV
jgi:hypothetical protein